VITFTDVWLIFVWNLVSMSSVFLCEGKDFASGSVDYANSLYWAMDICLFERDLCFIYQYTIDNSWI